MSVKSSLLHFLTSLFSLKVPWPCDEQNQGVFICLSYLHFFDRLV